MTAPMKDEALRALREKLEWRDRGDGWVAVSPIGAYLVLANQHLPKPFEVLAPSEYLCMADSEDDAKAAAQADYADRILSALDLDALTALEAENARLREALKPFSEAYRNYRDPGTNDLDNEQLASIHVPLGAWRRALWF